MATLAMVAGGKTIPVTVSIGIATAGRTDVAVTALIGRADDELYQAKRGGRDRIGASGDRLAGDLLLPAAKVS